MNPDSNDRMLAISQRVFFCLLFVYPKAHRDAYGAAMGQLFRDQSRDAWNESRHWGLVKLWLRVLPDLARSSFIERMSNLNPRKAKSDKIAALCRWPPPVTVFFTVATVVFLLTLSTSIAITYLLSPSYASTVRFKVEQDMRCFPRRGGSPTAGAPGFDPYFIQTTFEIMQSEVVLSSVIANLNLNEKWGKKFNNGATLKTAETMLILKNNMLLTPVRNTKIVALTVYDDDPIEAAQIANAMADSYRDYRERTQAAALKQVAVDPLAKQYELEETRIANAKIKLISMREQLKIGNKISINPTPLEQAYWDEQQELDQMLQMHKFWSSRIETETLDAQFPNADYLVQVIDAAEPG
ncbi:MAG: hypothetical protein ABSE48_13880, partial [Verrucomicrobiota bacterium]